MRACRNSARLKSTRLKSIWMLLAVAVCIGYGGMAAAQLVKPVTLTPPKRLAPVPLDETAKPETPRAEASSEATSGGYKSGPRGQSVTTLTSIGAKGIQVDNLQVVSPDSAGILSAENGGFGVDMWHGTSMTEALHLLQALPPRIASRTLASLVRRLLLTSAEPPMGEGNGEQLAVSRLQRLSAMGDYAAALDLLSIMPRQGRGPGLLRMEAELRFLSGDHIAACSLVGDEVRRSSAEFWQKALVFCQVLSGEPEKAELGITMLREVGAEDEIFYHLAEVMIQGEAAEFNDFKAPTPLTLIMLAQAKTVISPANLSDMSPGALRMAALNARLAAPIRLLATEGAARMRVFRDSALIKVYTTILAGIATADTAPDAELAAPLQRSIERAHLFAAATRANVPTAKAEAISAALRLAIADGAFAGVARLFRGQLKQIPISTDLGWFAADAFHIAISNGDQETAHAWLAMLRRSAAISEAAAGILKTLRPLVMVISSANNDSGKFDDLDGVDSARAVLIHALVDGLGHPVPPQEWLARADATSTANINPMPSPALWMALKGFNTAKPIRPSALETTSKFAMTGKLGISSGVTMETLNAPTAGTRSDIDYKAARLLLMVRVMGAVEPASVNPIVLSEVLRGMGALGLKDEAHALAVEVALGAGL
jgi:hypothetical protein